MLRVAENPVPRFPIGRPLSQDMGSWWVARVKPRQEKALAWDLARLGVGYYLPMLTKRTRRRDNGKLRKSLVCAFPGYLSVTDYEERKAEILRTGRILNLIKVSGQEQFVRELEQIYQALSHSTELEVQPHLAVGRRVMIASGPMQGLEGIVTDLRRPRKVFLNVEIFNRAVMVMVSPEELVPLEEPREGIRLRA
jgi:transcription antitermination factor NusG